jgi:hypothetical protein
MEISSSSAVDSIVPRRNSANHNYEAAKHQLDLGTKLLPRANQGVLSVTVDQALGSVPLLSGCGSEPNRSRVHRGGASESRQSPPVFNLHSCSGTSCETPPGSY